MKTRHILTLTVAAIMFFCIGGCAKQQFTKQRYWLDIERPKTLAGKTSDVILSVEPFSIDSAFRTQSIVYKKTAHEFESDHYMEYLIPPAKMITERTRQWLSDSGLFARVLQPGSIMKPTHVLEGHISKVYVDTFTGNQASAQLEITFYLLNKKIRKEEILFGKTFTATEIMVSPRAEDYFNALEITLTKILKQLEIDLTEFLN